MAADADYDSEYEQPPGRPAPGPIRRFALLVCLGVQAVVAVPWLLVLVMSEPFTETWGMSAIYILGGALVLGLLEGAKRWLGLHSRPHY